MLKKFFSIALLLTVCAVNASAPAVKPAAPVATASVAAAPAAEVKKSVEAAAPAACEAKSCTASTFSKAKSAVCGAFTTAKNAVVGHPYISTAVAAVAVAGVAYNQSETVRGWFGVCAEDASKCPCTKRDQLAA
jgi:hypothetical protein